MAYSDTTREEDQTVERLIRFMKAVENPEWMVDLVKKMNCVPGKLIARMEEEKKPIYHSDGSLMQQNTTIRINEVIRIIMETCGLDAKELATDHLMDEFRAYIVINGIQLKESRYLILVRDTILDLIEKHDLVNKPTNDFDIMDSIEDDIMESFCNALVKGGYSLAFDPLSELGTTILRNKIRETFKTYGMFQKG